MILCAYQLLHWELICDHKIDTAIYEIDTARIKQVSFSLCQLPDNFEVQSGFWCSASLEQKASIAQKSTLSAILVAKKSKLYYCQQSPYLQVKTPVANNAWQGLYWYSYNMPRCCNLISLDVERYLQKYFFITQIFFEFLVSKLLSW